MAGFRRAVEIASACWGGATFPILECADVDQTKRLCVDLGVDAVLACDDDPACRELADTDGFKWQGFRGAPYSNERSDRVVDLATVLVALRRAGIANPRARLLSWEAGDPDADLLSVLFGRLGEATPPEADLVHALNTKLNVRELAPSDPLPDDLGWVDGALAVGLWNVSALNRLRDTGVVIVDRSTPSDLVDFWNLRAIGNLVVPWDAQSTGRLNEFVRRILTELPRQSWGDDPTTRVSVFTRGDEVPDELQTLLALDDGVDLVQSFGDPARLTHLAAGIGTPFRTSFDVSVSGTPSTGESIRVPLPKTDLIPDQGGWDPRQYLCARVTFRWERELPERTSFRAPAVRGLCPALRWAVSVTAPLVRGVGDGVVVACRVTDDDLDLGILDSTYVIERLLQNAQLEARVSDAGLWMARIIDSLGGAGSSLASQPAVREVLERASRDKGANPKELRSEAAKAAGAWRDYIRVWQHGRDYEQWVLGVLASRRVIEPAFSYGCPACGLKQLLPPDRTGSVLRCEDCEVETPLALQVILGGAWRLTTRRLLDQKRLRATYPLLSSLRLLQDMSRDQAALHYALGLSISRGDRKFEIDFAILYHDDDCGPALIVGESKTRNEVAPEDVDNLELIQEAVRDMGVECFIAISCNKSELSAPERERLRQSADRFLWGIAPDKSGTSDVNLPIVLTRGPLTLPDDHTDHPRQAIGSHRTSLSALAHWTCKRELGLSGIGTPGDWRLRWNDD